ncbi:MAG: MoaD/ThiS family protein [Actinobacteria bacterium]|nr:MoaD/ThiS family protein [Actinomycetota bacterium]
MRVKARFTGILRHYAGVKEEDFELPDGAKVADLMLRVGRQFGPRLPKNMWDAAEEAFHPLIKATRRGTPIAEDDEVLNDGDEIYIISRMAGG